MLLSGLCAAGYAQEVSRRDTLGVEVYFRQGYSLLELDYRENGSRLAAFASQVESLRRDTLCRVKGLRIVGGASPEGVSTLNARLSSKRAANLAAWFERRLPDLGECCEVESVGVDWAGLTALVEASDMPYREEVLDILYHTPEWIVRDGKVVDGRKRQLGMLRGGRAWRYMEDHFFAQLRSTSVRVSCEFERLRVPPVVRDTVFILRRDTVILRDTVRICCGGRSRRPFYMSLKTNLLYDAALVPNIGAEFHLGKGWSVGGNWMYAWWKSDKRHRYWRIYGGELDVRKYFGRRASEKPLTGHHIGIYGQIFTYDFETGGRGYLGGRPGGTLWDKMNYAAGVEYGYALPVGRRLNLDFTLGIGYWGGEYQRYEPSGDRYVWQETRRRHWFGPTKAEVSLVWLIGYGNTNKGKGGKR